MKDQDSRASQGGRLDLRAIPVIRSEVDISGTRDWNSGFRAWAS
jgi:hypothetical protein